MIRVTGLCSCGGCSGGKWWKRAKFDRLASQEVFVFATENVESCAIPWNIHFLSQQHLLSPESCENRSVCFLEAILQKHWHQQYERDCPKLRGHHGGHGIRHIRKFIQYQPGFDGHKTIRHQALSAHRNSATIKNNTMHQSLTISKREESLDKRRIVNRQGG